MKALAGLITTGLLIFPTIADAQTLSVNDILDRLNQAVLTFKEGRFTFHDKMTKLVSDDDSSHNEHTNRCYFKLNPSDSLIKYQLASFRDDGYQQVYDGNHLFTVYDQTLEVIPKRNYPNQIKQLLGGFTGPTYITSTNHALQYFNQPITAQHLHLVSLTQFMGQECYQLRIVDSLNRSRRTEVNYYVSVHSFLPLRTITKLISIVGKTKETVIFDYSVTNVKAKLSADNSFSRDILTDYRIEKNYDPAEEEANNELLPIGSKAPNWNLPLITGNTLSLSELRGKVVILDFWFKACAPCQKQMIALQTLHEKFSADKVVIVGVNTIDDPKKDRLALFLKNRLITMPSVYQGYSIESLYKVRGSPALFMIDKQGQVIYTASGYSSTSVDKVNQLIIEQLNQ